MPRSTFGRTRSTRVTPWLTRGTHEGKNSTRGILAGVHADEIKHFGPDFERMRPRLNAGCRATAASGSFRLGDFPFHVLHMRRKLLQISSYFLQQVS